jgi:hypothetical protein
MSDPDPWSISITSSLVGVAEPPTVVPGRRFPIMQRSVGLTGRLLRHRVGTGSVAGRYRTGWPHPNQVGWVYRSGVVWGTIAPMSDAAIDPVQSPEAYRRQLLDLLGGDDPAAVQAATVARLRELVRDAGDGLRVRPEPTEWSVVECIGHLVDSELTTAARVRWILSEDQPDIVGYDQDLWVDRLRHRDDDPDDLIALFDALRGANLRLWEARPPADRERVGIHRERGPESYGLIVRLAAGHDRFHIGQAERALATVRS